MKSLNFYYVYWLLTRFAKSIGVWGLIGIVIIAGSFIFYISKTVKVEEQIVSSKYELEHLKIDKSFSVDSQVTPTQTTAQEVIDFYKLFPAGVTLPKWLSLIDETAVKQHLLLNRGDYKLTQIKQGQLSRYEIVLPVVGKYSQIRQFITDVLQKMPALALDDLQIRRENSLSPLVEARLVFVLFLKGDSWGK